MLNKSKINDEETDDVPHAVVLLEARLCSYFAKFQNYYELSKDVITSEKQNIFLAKTSNIATLRSEFNAVVENYNLEKLKHDKTYVPNFSTWEALEDMYAHIKTVIQSLNENKKTEASTFSQKLKLPPIQLPQFDGNRNNWSSFFECFNRLVHNNPTLPESDKAYYLYGQLSGKALSAIAGIEPTGANYKLIYATLVDKYQDLRLLGTTYLNQMFDLKTLINPSAEGLNNFIDQFATSVSAFEKLSIPDKLDFLFLFLALKKLDNETIHLFENHVRSEKLPTYTKLITFLREQSKILERTNPVFNKTASQQAQRVPTPRSVKSFLASSTGSEDSKPCVLCQKIGHDHFYRCSDFMKLTPKERYEVVKKYNCCVRCLSTKHKSMQCNSTKSCGLCQTQTHHSLLHFPRSGIEQINPVMLSVASTSVESTTVVSEGTVGALEEQSPHNSISSGVPPPVAPIAHPDAAAASNADSPVSLCSMQGPRSHASQPSTVMPRAILSTARVCIVDARGNPQLVRCLIDNGSMDHFITKECCERLFFDYESLPDPVLVTGFGGSSKRVDGKIDLVFTSRFDEKISYPITPLVVDNITDTLPTAPIDRARLQYLANIPLADDTFHEPGPIDMLIGAVLFPRLLRHKSIEGPPGTPDAIKTSLGFILMGEAPTLSAAKPPKPHAMCCFTGVPLDLAMQRFWELEDSPSQEVSVLSTEEEECEEIYKTTTHRDSSGRYIVALPFKKDPNVLGSSVKVAKRRFMSLERKLQSSASYRVAFDDIIEEYLEKDYITPTILDDSTSGYVIPQDGVFRESSVSTKVRMVLDMSAETDSGLSLNDILHVGPNLQPDLYSVLLKFRLYPIACCADVKQMFLQIKMSPEFHKYQRIFYRFDPADPLQLFEFKRVCFGSASSPYLALRTLNQLAQDEQTKLPLAADVIKRGDFYMDDVCFSTQSVAKARAVSAQLIGMFAAGGFDLMKWSSNSKELLSSLPADYLHPQAVEFSSGEVHKVLGIQWDYYTDTFRFTVSPFKVAPPTKRGMLSVIARLWDILGFAAPLILYAKLLIKELWLLKLGWDDVPPPHILKAWNKFEGELNLLSNLTIPRYLGATDDSKDPLQRWAIIRHKIATCPRNPPIFSSHIPASESAVNTDCHLAGIPKDLTFEARLAITSRSTPRRISA
ncbi:pao retrotransposon peptidase domain-containing protein [Phthorimaea operculella]|nr:pao retrotransposon peptidase domain-containing protein [Phthorimaea operculella]